MPTIHLVSDSIDDERRGRLVYRVSNGKPLTETLEEK
jgi:hypothetical protein